MNETTLETVSPEGLRVRADMIEGKLNDSGSTARHIRLAADEIERLRTRVTELEQEAERVIVRW